VTSAERAFADLVTIAQVIKPQGRKGEVLAKPLSDRPDRFTSLRRAFVPGAAGLAREVVVSSAWPHKDRWVLKLEGVDSIDDAERLRGVELRVGEEDLLALPEGSYYHHQLRGLRVEAPGGEVIGKVEDLLETGGGAVVLVVRGPGGERLIPLAAPFIDSVEPHNGRLVARAPETAESHAR
jgi:16S rRNA processing protein RimM